MPEPGPALPELDALHAQGVLSALDLELGRLLRRLAPEDSPWVAVTAALASRATQAGHVCLPLRKAPHMRITDAEEKPVQINYPPLAQWLQALRSSRLISDGTELQPLVLVDDRLYLHRYFSYERRLVRALEERLRNNNVRLSVSAEVTLKELFADALPGDLQRQAALLACTHRLCVISGGPGTGKTTTVVKVLVAVVQQLKELGQEPHLAVLAPTGKAATRLAESLEAGLERLSLTPSDRESLAVAPSTIHRALGYQPRSPTHFRHDAGNPLPANIVVVDEASMVDLALMTKLTEAVPKDAHLILLGDRDQLASVETGAVFGDMFESPEQAASTLAIRHSSDGASKAPAIAECIIHLEKSYRYAAHGGIAELAAAIRAGRVDDALTALSLDGLRWVELTENAVATGDCATELKPLVVDGFGPLCEATDPEERLKRLSAYRILSPHRHGKLGVAGLNELCERVLIAHGLQVRPGAYPGQPIIISQNDYQTDLYNGDVGVLDRNALGRLTAFFPGTPDVRQLSMARLPSYDTVFAMTIHKSQGSEFDRILVVLPHHSSPLLSRELLYTAVTRAKSHVTLACTRESLRVAIERRLERASGLNEALWRYGRDTLGPAASQS